MRNRFLLPVLALVPLLFSCSNSGVPVTEPQAVVPVTPPTAKVNLDQGWTDEQVTWWYEVTQGARVLPLSWFLALERSGSTQLLLDDANFAGRYGWPMIDVKSEGVRLPRGFAIDQQDDSAYNHTKLRWKQGQAVDEKWAGITCSGCHNSQISYQGTSFAVPGGQTRADVQLALVELNAAFAATLSDSLKFDRFAERVLGAENTATNRAMLRNAVHKLRYDSRNHLYSEQGDTDGIAYGPGRLDAVGHIYDRVARLVEPTTPPKVISDAPVDYPFLWNVPQLDRVQWTGFAPNLKVAGYDLGALIRNIGEVSGVFADMEVGPNGLNYISSVNVDSLLEIENRLGKLKPPKWPSELFGAPKTEAIAMGKDLFASNCAGCHTAMDRADLSTPILTDQTRLAPTNGSEPLATDPVAACNGYQVVVDSGEFKNMPELVSGQAIMGDQAYLLDMTAWLQVGTILNSADENLAAAGRTFLAGAYEQVLNLPLPAALDLLAYNLSRGPVRHFSEDKTTRMAECLDIDHKLIAYKARPLNGIWATAPYLHNGSVPTLYDLMLPPAERPKTFYAGSTEYDPLNGGYRTDAAAPGNRFLFDTSILGNLNGGHVYGVDTLTEAQRRALVEYMKTL
ncbi:MAG: di-heme-cytochrome C peroxidase [Stagnimonas sp.]|nr:di-heme-cytochrome C peroxidase [Stagnimonas sp.]